MNLIVAVDKNWGIGCENKLLFSIPDDLKNFRKLTKGKVVVMGRRTLESLPGGLPLKDRTNIVLSRDKELQIPGAVVCNSIDNLLDELEKYDDENIFIIGGQTVYEELLDYCNTAYITEINAEFPADAFFPDITKMPNWVRVDESKRKEHEGIRYIFCEYARMQRMSVGPGGPPIIL